MRPSSQRAFSRARAIGRTSTVEPPGSLHRCRTARGAPGSRFGARGTASKYFIGRLRQSGEKGVLRCAFGAASIVPDEERIKSRHQKVPGVKQDEARDGSRFREHHDLGGNSAHVAGAEQEHVAETFLVSAADGQHLPNRAVPALRKRGEHCSFEKVGHWTRIAPGKGFW